MAIVNVVDNETGDSSEYASTGGTFSISSASPITGTYSLLTNPTTTATGFASVTGISADGSSNASTSIATSYTRFSFKPNTLPASGDEELFTGNSTTNARKFGLRIGSTGKLRMYNQASVAIGSLGTTVLSAGTTYRIECTIPTGTSAAWEVKVNGTVELSGSTDDFTANNTATLKLGKALNRNGNTVSFSFDNFLWSDSAYPGAGQSTQMVPTATGDSTQWTAVGAASDVLCTKEVPNDSDTTYISDLASGDADVMKMTASGAHGSVNCVKIKVIARVPVTAGNIKVRGRSGSTNSDTTGVATTTTYTLYAKIFETDPATGNAWTIAAVDAFQAGVVQNSTNIDRVTAVYMSVDYGTAVTSTAADSPTTTDSVARILTLLRTAADAPQTTDSVSRTGTFNRTASDAPHTTDTVARVLTLLRTVSDAPLTTDTVSRLLTLLRTIADAPTTTETVARALTLIRSASDSPQTIDSVSQTLTLLRTLEDFPLTTETVVVTKMLYRTVSDAPTTTDSVDITVIPGPTSGTMTFADQSGVDGGRKMQGGGYPKRRPLPRRSPRQDKPDLDAERLRRIIREEEEIIGLL